MNQKKKMSLSIQRSTRIIHPLIGFGKFQISFKKLSFIAVFCATTSAHVFAQTDTLQINSRKDSADEQAVRLLYNSVSPNLTATSTGAVYNKDLIKSPVTNVLNALTGRLAGIYTEQYSGQPANDGVGLSLHGRSPVVLVDGVVRNLTTLDLEEIESVTVLKDAVSTAMLGVRGANGAILITTRKGTPGKQTISFTAQTAIQQPLKIPQTLSAYDYSRLRNEAIDNELRVNPSLATSLNRLRYSDADIQLYKDGTDPFGHPDVDWQKQLLKNSSTFSRYSLNASGGNNFAKYFVALEHFNQQGLFKEDPVNKYPTNNMMKGYLARTNVDINITPKLSAGIALLGRVINGNEPAGVVTGTNTSGGTSSIFSALLTTPNNAYPVYNSDSSFGASSDYTMPNFTNTGLQQAANLQGLVTGSGYLQSYRRDILTDVFLKRTLDEILPGLWIKGRFSYSSSLTENITRIKGFVTNRLNGQVLTPFGLKIDQTNLNGISTQGRSKYTEASLGYDHTFDRTHGLNVLLMVNQDASSAGSDLPYTISGTSGKVSYNYKEKYVVEAAYGWNGSNRYPGGKTDRGFFPAAGVAWNITKEDFASKLNWLSNLKLYASYGKTGNDNPGYFSYIQRYPGYSQPVFGTSATSQASIIQGTLAYPGITWEKADKTNIGIQGSILKNKLGFTVEYYNNKFYDLLIQRGRNTQILGVAYPNENIGINRYKGIDLQLSWQQNINSFQYFIAGNASLQNSKVIFADEVNQPYGYMKRTGQMVGRPFGYVADGFFQSDADIAGKATFVGYVPQPGDIKYKDLNNDGVINQLDQTAIGADKPLIIYGANLGFTWKWLDFSALVQGVGNRNIFLTGNRFYEFQNGGLGQAYQQQLDRWTPTNTGASYPRLGIGNNINNQAFSTFQTRSGDYVRLKNVEIGFTLPVKLLNKAKLQTMRIFANGLNLLTASKVKDIDPEVYNGSYPIQRLFNFGINIKL
ncbi:SusC/RagA family TonB-linked outer membrane protein [soil metagenome]